MVSADKFRAEAGEQSGSIEFGTYIPDVAGADCIVPDDELSSGETLDGVGETLKRMGANSVIAVATHGKFVKGGRVRMMSSRNVDMVFVTDTLPQPVQNRQLVELMGMEDKIRVVHVAGVFGEAMRIVLGGNGGTMQQLYEIPFEQFNIH
jgi:ribose-phosphate pyrophosphokinase